MDLPEITQVGTRSVPLRENIKFSRWKARHRRGSLLARCIHASEQANTLLPNNNCLVVAAHSWSWLSMSPSLKPSTSHPTSHPPKNQTLAYLPLPRGTSNMQLPHRSAWPQRLAFYLVALFYLTSTVCAKESECQPIYWEPGQFEKRDQSDTNAALNSTTTASASISSSLPATATSTSAALVPVTISPLINEDPQPGEINCRDTDSTEGMEINYYTCTALAARNRISVDTLFGLNPGLDRDCGNIEADTEYCVRGCK